MTHPEEVTVHIASSFLALLSYLQKLRTCLLRETGLPFLPARTFFPFAACLVHNFFRWHAQAQTVSHACSLRLTVGVAAAASITAAATAAVSASGRVNSHDGLHSAEEESDGGHRLRELLKEVHSLRVECTQA
eukprot:5551339-Pleurochrysis_carterae.AAC.1